MDKPICSNCKTRHKSAAERNICELRSGLPDCFTDTQPVYLGEMTGQQVSGREKEVHSNGRT